jgi:hypothetical protein
MSALLGLHNEILLEILKRLDAQTRANFAQTCRLGNFLVSSEELYQSILRKEYDLAVQV